MLRLGLTSDPAQRAAIQVLRDLTRELLARPCRLGFWQRRRLRRNPDHRIEPVTGVYLWGDVGRGKTFLMDLFYEALPIVAKRRCHFHRFMQQAHTALKELGGRQQPLEIVAHRLARQVRVLCFDELAVDDIADAMILGGLFAGLFRRGVTLVATSNTAPDRLYRDGLQRSRFLPAIELLQRHCRVHRLAGETDYRLRTLVRVELYHAPLDSTAEQQLEHYFEQLSPEPGRRDVRLRVLGRTIRARRCADGIAWFDFGELCDGPRSQNDYIELARQFQTVLVSAIPRLDWQLENQARRFIALVDEFYDRNVKLIVSAAVPLAELYWGQRLAFEFERTRSRLVEMQSREYLAKPHRP